MSEKSRKLADTMGKEESGDASRFIQLFMAHERQLRFFVHQLLPDRNDVDEVMQNASVVL
ncbi:hypothetical protein [Bremerella alba]|uniref:Uncharacterized protein n=1 Tax=Bremerella alba TaxID=980252 RepID=A0A7V9A5E1_9BACT|nr:hypothetical protein [Bremerella alba]MBA2113255.1 hypothetical protein [Bremerella alba]